jgi:hypothetical protein
MLTTARRPFLIANAFDPSQLAFVRSPARGIRWLTWKNALEKAFFIAKDDSQVTAGSRRYN